MEEPKITVLIPTRERCDVLEKSLKTVTAQNYDNLVIIISDNYSRDGTEEVVRSIGDRRVKYINTGRRLSMSHNWEFALSQVDHGWVTILGDDDGLLPNSLRKVAEIVMTTDIQAIRSTVCKYIWGSEDGNESGRLAVPLTSGCEIRDSRQWLTKVLLGQSEYSQLPMLYNGGYVNMTAVAKIKGIGGVFYRSCQPDVYSAIALGSVIDEYVYCYEPLAINGASRHSNGTSHFSAKNGKAGVPALKFRSEPNIPFHKDMPLCSDGSHPLSLAALVYESYLQSAFLREGPIENIHERQLAVILATSGRHKEVVRDWGRLFAAAHGLNFDKIDIDSQRERVFFALQESVNRLVGTINTYSVGSPARPIRDIYEASLAAASVRELSAGRLRNIFRLIGRASQKAFRHYRQKRRQI